jgi:DNA-binding NarL/FixJ family response regulator
VVGAGAKILGPITIGARTRVGANAVVVKSVPPDSVVVGIPGRVTHRKDTSRMIQYENGSIHSLDLEHGSMPDMTGIEALKKIREIDPKAKVVMISAMGQESMVKEAIINGAKSFIVKPYKEEHITQTLLKIAAD